MINQNNLKTYIATSINMGGNCMMDFVLYPNNHFFITVTDEVVYFAVLEDVIEAMEY